MAEPFLAELRIMSFDWAPKGWTKCDGQRLPINQALFSLLDTTFGGDGWATFAPSDQCIEWCQRGVNSPRIIFGGFSLL